MIWYEANNGMVCLFAWSRASIRCHKTRSGVQEIYNAGRRSGI